MSFIKKWSGHGCLLFSNSVKATYQFYGTKCDPVCKNRSYLHIQLMNHVFPSELANKVNITSLIVRTWWRWWRKQHMMEWRVGYEQLMQGHFSILTIVDLHSLCSSDRQMKPFKIKATNKLILHNCFAVLRIMCTWANQQLKMVLSQRVVNYSFNERLPYQVPY